MRAGSLRHRVRIEQPTTARDPSSGAVIGGWSLFIDKMPAEVMPLSGRDLIAAQSTHSEISTRATIRETPLITPDMRVIHLGVIYNIEAILPDPTFQRHLTLMLSSGVSNGN